MQEVTLEYVEQLADQLSADDRRSLIEHLESQLGQSESVVDEPKKTESLRGLWQGKFPDDLDLDAALYEIRHEWEKEWPEVFGK